MMIKISNMFSTSTTYRMINTTLLNNFLILEKMIANIKTTCKYCDFLLLNYLIRAEILVLIILISY